MTYIFINVKIYKKSEVVLTVSLKLFGKEGVCKFTAEGRNIDTVYNAEYEEGDVWHIDTAKDSFLKLSLDQTLLSSIVYLPTGALDFEIPFGYERTCCYAPSAFSGDSHKVVCSVPTDDEIYSEREISFNPHARHNKHQYFPSAYANFVTNEHPSLYERNAIDGVIKNERHGVFPHHSWGGGKREDLVFEVRFGREVELSCADIFIRADFPHDTYWEEADVEFSDGTSRHIELLPTQQAQHFEFPPKRTEYVRLTGLKQKRTPEGELSFAALSGIRIYGKYIKNEGV